MKTKLIISVLAVLALIQIGVTASANPLRGDERITLELDAVPLASVLSMIAQQHSLNIVLASDVQGEITIRLEDVDLETALDAILTANGYHYFIKENVIVVKSVTSDASGELVSKTFTLKFLEPSTVKKALESRKSPIGHIIVLDREKPADGTARYTPNRIVITDFPDRVEQMSVLVEEMDVAEPVILIEAKIIETKIDSKSKLGFQWPTSVGSRLGNADAGGNAADAGGVSQSADRSGVYDPNNGNWTWGTLSIDELNLVLDALEQDGNSKLISDPRVTTLANHEAIIKIETIVPIQTINRFTEGSATSDIVTFQDEEVGISLRVTPRITGDGRILLDVNPQVEDIISFTGTPDNQKPITTSRSITTRIIVGDGETAALGGLLKEDKIESVSRVPLLGRIPLIGGLLFTNKSVEKTTTDLIILITPTVLR
jgi:type IV pilus secretin PilQ/predicted competence protein